MAHTLRLAEQPIAQASVTPADAACQRIIQSRLEALGFVCEPMHSGPDQWRVSNMHAGTGVGNVIPGTAIVDFNFRFSTASTPAGLQQRLQQVLERHGVKYELAWTLGAEPFVTAPGTLVEAVRRAIKGETGIDTVLSTTGGTSDARFIARICPQVVELGPPNASIHQIDEHVCVEDVEPLKNIYRRVLENLSPGELA